MFRNENVGIYEHLCFKIIHNMDFFNDLSENSCTVIENSLYIENHHSKFFWMMNFRSQISNKNLENQFFDESFRQKGTISHNHCVFDVDTRFEFFSRRFPIYMGQGVIIIAEDIIDTGYWFWNKKNNQRFRDLFFENINHHRCDDRFQRSCDKFLIFCDKNLIFCDESLIFCDKFHFKLPAFFSQMCKELVAKSKFNFTMLAFVVGCKNNLWKIFIHVFLRDCDIVIIILIV